MFDTTGVCYFDDADLLEMERNELDTDYEILSEDGYIWRDASGKEYREEDLTNSHLKNILKYCERAYRPSNQIRDLKELAKKRGIK